MFHSAGSAMPCRLASALVRWTRSRLNLSRAQRANQHKADVKPLTDLNRPPPESLRIAQVCLRFSDRRERTHCLGPAVGERDHIAHATLATADAALLDCCVVHLPTR